MNAGVQWMGLIVGLFLCWPRTAAAEPGLGGFTFSPPPGWIDISRGAPEAQRRKAPPALLAQADNPKMAFVAFEPNSNGDGFGENVNAVVETGKRPPLATSAGLAELAQSLEGEIAKQGLTYRSLKIDVVKVAGVTAGRLVGEIKSPATVVNIVQYTIPGERSYATLTFSTTADNFARYEPIFEASAQATRGAVEPRSSSDEKSERSGMLIGAVAGVIGASFGVRAMRKRKARAAAAASPPS